MNHRRPLQFLIAALFALVIGAAVVHAITPPEPPMVIDQLWTDANLRTDCIIMPMRDPFTPRRKVVA